MRKPGPAVAALIAMVTLTSPSAALAGPADLDPTFGSGGLVIVPGGDRFDPQGAPMLDAGGEVALAGLLRNSSDRVFLARFTPAGDNDLSFHGDGDVHTNVIGTPDRGAAVAETPDGKYVVAGGAANKATVTLERYLHDGRPDTTFGSNGKLTYTTPGSYLRAVAILPLPDGKTLVSANTDPGGTTRAFVVMRFGGKAIDTTWGTKGVARVAFGTRNATAYDLALLPDGRVLAAGAVGDGDAMNTAVVRLTRNGTLDTGFGTGGSVETDASGSSKADRAAGIVAHSTGEFAVAGPAGASGMVTRYSSAGTPASFGTGGTVRAGFAPLGGTATLADIVIDNAGRYVVAGRSQDGGLAPTSRWIVARLLPSPSAPQHPLDAGFGTNGVASLEVCENHGDYGPTGLAVASSGRINVVGACNDTGEIAGVRLLGTDAFPGATTLTVGRAAAAAGYERIPFANVEPAQVLRAFEDLQLAELRESPARPNPARPNPARPNPARPNPIRAYTTLRSLPARPNPARPNPISEHILLSEMPLLNQTWSEVLGSDAPAQALTLADAFRINPDAVGALTLEDVDPEGTIMRRLSLASIVLGLRPLAVLPPPAGFPDWCAYLQGKAVDCSNRVSVETTTLFDLEVAGIDLSDYLSKPLKLAPPSILGTGDDRAPLAYIPIKEMELSRTALGSAPASDFGSLVNCGTDCSRTLSRLQHDDPDGFSSATLGQVLELNPLPVPSVTLGDVLAGLLAPQDIPFERAPLRNLLDVAALRSDELQTYTTAFKVDCIQAPGLQAVASLPDDSRPIPRSATLQRAGAAAVPVGDPARAADGSLVFDLSGACDGARAGAVADVTFAFQAEPGSTLGPRTASMTVRSDFGRSVAPPVAIAVDDSHDPGDDLENVRPLGTDGLRTGHLAHADDVDSYSFAPDRPGRVTITLTHLPADYDLLVFGPGDGLESSPARPNPARPNALAYNPVPDASEGPADPTVVPPDGVQDIPARPNPARPNPARPNALRAQSIKRGHDAESVTLVIHPSDVGQAFTAQVVGYNGANDDEPYVIRRSDRPAPPAPPCMPHATVSTGAGGAFPSDVPPTTRTLFVVNQERLGPQAGEVRRALDAVAAVTDGVVVPVEGPTRDRFASWDQSPCDVAKANDVVEGVIAAIDDVRALGGGLPDLRSIVLVGSDDVLPQARIPDRTVMANESSYADETVLRDQENPVSAALRSGYLLSDDPYGDFDPSSELSVPDVALGRLVETPAEIIAQLEAYLTGAKYVTPTDVSAAGYDFLKDGAQAQLDALARIAESQRSLIGEDWTASQLKAEMNRSNAGFTAIGAHYSHWEALPADAFNNLSPNLLNAKDVTPAAKSLAFSVGCHSGLSLVVPVVGATPDEADRLGGWVDRHVGSGSLYVGNTGYGYGDTEVVGMSEKLMADFSVFAATKRATVGQALMFAKQANAATLTDAYWNKSSMVATFYGLPFYTVAADGTAAGSALPPAVEPPAEVTRVSEPRPLSVSPQPVTTARGRYWQVGDEEPLVINNRPIQPQTRVDVTADDGLRVHGYLPDDFTTVDIGGVDPVIARPTLDLAANEPEPDVRTPLFPSANFAVDSVQRPNGRRDVVTFVAGEFRDGAQRLFTHVAGRTLRSNSDDFEPPMIELVDGIVIGGQFSVAVQTDDADVAGGNVLYRTDGGSDWHRVGLAPVAGGRLGGGAVLPQGSRISEAKIYVFDEAGNVASSDNKVRGYAFAPTAVDPDGPRFAFDPPNAGYYEDSPTITVDPRNAANARFEYSIDGGEWTPYAGAFRIPEPDDGEHFLRLRSSTGAETLDRLAIDSQPPRVTGQASPGPNDAGWNAAASVTVTFECADAVSGVASCPSPVVVTDEGQRSVSGTATDRAGHSATTAVDVRIDRTPPRIEGARDAAPNSDGWYGGSVGISWTCEDDLSGVGFCSQPAVVDTEGRNQFAQGRAEDRAGNESTATESGINIDRTRPSEVTITSSGILIGNLQGTATDALSGVRRVVVTYRRQNGTETKTTQARLVNCSASTGRCQWAADPPGLGFWEATAQATDRAGNVRPTDGPTLISIF